jgi:hypothetical protein
MKSRLAGVCVAGALVACLAGSSACDPVVTVTYKQLGACGGAGVGPNLAYVFFRFDGINNSTNASFTFDPFHLEVPSQVSNYPTPIGKIDELVTYQQTSSNLLPGATKVTLAPGVSEALSTYGVMLVETGATDGASEAANTSYFLTYTDGGIVLDKENSSQTTWPYTPRCADINFNQ